MWFDTNLDHHCLSGLQLCVYLLLSMVHPVTSVRNELEVRAARDVRWIKCLESYRNLILARRLEPINRDWIRAYIRHVDVSILGTIHHNIFQVEKDRCLTVLVPWSTHASWKEATYKIIVRNLDGHRYE